MIRIQQAVKILKTGGVVVYPTDTAYGLAVDATNSSAVEKLYRLKGRDFYKPIHVIIPYRYYHATKRDSKCPVALNKDSKKLIDKFWPGPLTIVLPLKAKGKSWQKLSAGSGTIGIRMPNHPIPSALVAALKRPITTTSANLSGRPNCYSLIEVKKQFRKARLKPDFYIDGGKLPGTLPSTVVSLIKGVKILRPGPIGEKEIKTVLRAGLPLADQQYLV